MNTKNFEADRFARNPVAGTVVALVMLGTVFLSSADLPSFMKRSLHGHQTARQQRQYDELLEKSLAAVENHTNRLQVPNVEK
jgi:hypothetical protein